ncbi:MAG: hypothetical protein AAGI11_15145 [Pseudomonadota bacterium]
MTALARRTDPETSHAAAKRVNLRGQRAIIAGLLKSAPDSTYQELFKRHAANRRRAGKDLQIPDAPSVMKRLNGWAKRTGERACRVTGRTASTWALPDSLQ